MNNGYCDDYYVMAYHISLYDSFIYDLFVYLTANKINRGLYVSDDMYLLEYIRATCLDRDVLEMTGCLDSYMLSIDYANT